MGDFEVASVEEQGPRDPRDDVGLATTLFDPTRAPRTHSWSASIDSFLADVARMSSGREARAIPSLSEGFVVADRYRLRRSVGSGAYGVVWVADDGVTESEVAIKLLLAASAEGAARIRAEVASLRSLRDAGAVTLLDEGLDAGFVFIVMPLVLGAPFPGLPIPVGWETLAPIAARLLETLSKVHALGIVHRDLKPANVLVGSDGIPIVLDFGLSLTSFCLLLDDGGRVAGTPAYLAPEQIESSDIDLRADLYAVGAMLYQSLTGCLPHEASSVHALLMAKNVPPIPLREREASVPRHVAATIDALLATHPADRPSSATETLRRLMETPTASTSTCGDLPLGSTSPSRAAIRELFESVDPYAFSPEDATDLLWRETEGRVEDVRTEIDTWLSHRVCRWSRSPGSPLVVDPLAFDRLVARRLLSDPNRVASENEDAALALARSLAEDGRLALAAAVLQLAPRAAVASSEGVDGRAVEMEARMELAVDIALSDGTAHALDRVLYDIYRSDVRSPGMLHLEKLVRAALAVGPWTERALDLASEVEPFSNLRLELARRSLRVIAARRSSSNREAKVLEELGQWATHHVDPLVRGTYAGWLGRLRYREGRFSEAADLHCASAMTMSWRTERATALMYAASCSMEAFEGERAAELAEEAHEVFAACRHLRGRAQAAWIRRTLRYRRGEAIRADRDYVDHVSGLGIRELEGLACMTEATIAWRTGDLATARQLAMRGREIWRNWGESAGALLIVSALAIVTSPPGEVSSAEVEKLARKAEDCTTPGVGIQILALLDDLRVETTSSETLAALMSQVESAHWKDRIDVLSIDEARGRLARRDVRPLGVSPA